MERNHYLETFHRNAHKVKAHPSLQKGGCHEAHDIEDLVKIGQVVKGALHVSKNVSCLSLSCFDDISEGTLLHFRLLILCSKIYGRLCTACFLSI